ncbi:MAG: response regulator, partial [Mariprofundaceae bacterium]|nr:response regulator [Mariprofundaceae bacterium]
MSQLKVLLVEDESSTREMYRTVIKHAGFQVRDAASYGQAVALLNEPFDLALVDLVLGRKSGIELLKYIHHHHPNCPVIIVSAYASKENAIKALHEGAADYLEKPVDPHALGHVIRHWTSHHLLKRENLRLREESDLNREIRESELRYRALIEAV